MSAPAGSVRQPRTLLLEPRPRPLLVALYAALLGEAGLLSRRRRRRLAHLLLRALPAGVALGLAGLLALRLFARPALGWPQGAAAAALLLTMGAVAWRRARGAAAGRPSTAWEQLELGALFLVAAFAVAQTSGGAAAGEPPLFPVVYLVMAFLVAFLARPVGLVLAACAVGLDAAIWRARGGAPDELPGLAAHAAFLLLFALLYHAALSAQVASSRRAGRRAVARRLREIEERAREYRLLSPGEGAAADPAERERRFAEASVVEIEAAVRGVLEVAEVALRAHTAALYVLSADDRELTLRECRSRSDRVARGPLPAGEGPLGGAVRRRAAVRLCGDVRSASHYQDGTRPGALLAVPLLDRRGGHVRGALLVDRMEAVAFGDEDERLLTTLAGEVLRAVEGERILSALKAARDEKERFYGAIERLNRASSGPEVVEALLQVSREMVDLSFAAVTLVERGEGGEVRHRVARCSLPQAEGGAGPIEGLVFADNVGLVAQAVKLDAALPGRELKLDATVIFDERTRLRGLSSLKVLPLRAGKRVVGTLVAGRRRGALGAEELRQLEVVALQAGASLERAELFDRTERMATTDGLTGLVNHRTFQERFDARLAEAGRYGRKLSLLLTDIDHFKSVNDTYGHPVGDQVLRGVAALLAQEARATDLVARYGGEEFAVVMPETDAEGARVIAERIRERVAAAVFDTGLGPLRVTVSLGVATFPGDGERKARLVEAADGCLYAAKRGGRNRTVLASQARSGKSPPPDPARIPGEGQPREPRT